MKNLIIPNLLTGIYLLITLLFPMSVSAHVPEIIPPDNQYSLLVEFFKTDTILLVLPAGKKADGRDSAIIESYPPWGPAPVYSYTDENDPRVLAGRNHMRFYGPFSGFRTSFDIPFQKAINGFSFQGKEYTAANEGFFFIKEDASALFTCSNSLEVPLPLAGYMAGAYQIYVFRENELLLDGFCSEDEEAFRLNDLSGMRDNSFSEPVESKNFVAFFSKELPDTIDRTGILVKMEEYTDSLLGFFEFDRQPVPGMKIYFYSGMKDTRFFLAQPEWTEVHGKSFGTVNHISGTGLEILKHETGHSIIGFFLGNHPSAFWSEGIRQYSDYYFSREAFERDRQVCRENKALIIPDFFSAENSGFYNSWANYSISGQFTAFVIQKLGLSRFKEAYRSNRISEVFLELGITSRMLTEEFLKSLEL